MNTLYSYLLHSFFLDFNSHSNICETLASEQETILRKTKFL